MCQSGFWSKKKKLVLTIFFEPFEVEVSFSDAVCDGVSLISVNEGGSMLRKTEYDSYSIFTNSVMYFIDFWMFWTFFDLLKKKIWVSSKEFCNYCKISSFVCFHLLSSLRQRFSEPYGKQRLLIKFRINGLFIYTKNIEKSFFPEVFEMIFWNSILAANILSHNMFLLNREFLQFWKCISA